MGGQGRKWIDVRIGITAEEATAFLEELAANAKLREELERDPRGTLSRFNIELNPEDVPPKVQLPDPETIAGYARSLRDTKSLLNDWPVPAHGFCVLWVAHGNGAVPPPPPPPES